MTFFICFPREYNPPHVLIKSPFVYILPVFYLERNAMEFVKVKISDILPAEYNPRKELKPDDEEFIKISNSIDEFGYSEPIIVNKDMTIIGGHQRLNVLKYKGVEEIEVVMLDLPKNKEKALNIALNKITGYWDMDRLTDLLLDLGNDGYDLELTGFNMDEIGGLFSEPEEK